MVAFTNIGVHGCTIDVTCYSCTCSIYMFYARVLVRIDVERYWVKTT